MSCCLRSSWCGKRAFLRQQSPVFSFDGRKRGLLIKPFECHCAAFCAHFIGESSVREHADDSGRQSTDVAEWHEQSVTLMHHGFTITLYVGDHGGHPHRGCFHHYARQTFKNRRQHQHIHEFVEGGQLVSVALTCEHATLSDPVNAGSGRFYRVRFPAVALTDNEESAIGDPRRNLLRCREKISEAFSFCRQPADETNNRRAGF